MKKKILVKKRKTRAFDQVVVGGVAVSVANASTDGLVTNGIVGKRKRKLGTRSSKNARRAGIQSQQTPGTTATSTGTVPQALAAPRRALAFAGERWRSHGPVVLAPEYGIPCEAAVVWLHGPDGDPADWSSGLRAICQTISKRSACWKFVSLRAPRLRMPYRGGERMAAWGELLELGCIRPGSADHENQDASGHLAATVVEVRRCLEELERCDGVPPSQVVIGGFSQGAACALQAALAHPRPVGGCVSLAGWLLPGAHAALSDNPSRETSFLVCHGARDDKVELSCSSRISDVLREAGAKVQFESFSHLGHTASQRELVRVARFLRVTLAC